MTAEISQEAIDRMAALIRDYVAACAHCTVGGQFLTEARAIVAMLPVEVDPDLVEARKIALADGYGPDNGIIILLARTLKRGRELAKARAGEGSV